MAQLNSYECFFSALNGSKLFIIIPIEIGRWRRTPRENRKCHLYNTDTGDEFHYLLVCKELNNLRRQFIDANFITRPNIISF